MNIFPNWIATPGKVNNYEYSREQESRNMIFCGLNHMMEIQRTWRVHTNHEKLNLLPISRGPYLHLCCAGAAPASPSIVKVDDSRDLLGRQKLRGRHEWLGDACAVDDMGVKIAFGGKVNCGSFSVNKKKYDILCGESIIRWSKLNQNHHENTCPPPAVPYTALFTLEINVPHLVTHPTVSFMLTDLLTLSGSVEVGDWWVYHQSGLGGEILFPASPSLAHEEQRSYCTCLLK